MTKSVISILLFLFLCVTVSYAQDVRVSLTRNNLTLYELFRKIEAQTDFNFGYSNRVNRNATIVLTEQTGTVMQIVSQALQNTPYTFRTFGKYILIVPDVVEVEEVPPPPVREEPVVIPVIIEEVEPEEVVVVYLPEPVEEEEVPPPYYPEPTEPVYIVEVIETPEQEVFRGFNPPRLALKTNVLYAATATINLGVEFRLGNHLTLDILGGWNPFVFGNDAGLTHVLIQPTLRYWTRESFSGDFFGFSLLYSDFNIGGVELPFNMTPALGTHRFRGNAFGVSLQYGHLWRLSQRLRIETSLNVGHLFFNYETFESGRDGRKVGSNMRHFFGPTNASISVVYIIR